LHAFLAVGGGVVTGGAVGGFVVAGGVGGGIVVPFDAAGVASCRNHTAPSDQVIEFQSSEISP
jgi:hypothetical protein